VNPGTCWGVLGRNGAGKTTLLRTLIGIQKKYQGTVTLFNEKPGALAIVEKMGFCPDIVELPHFLTIGEYLTWVVSLREKDKTKRKEKWQEVLAWMELSAKPRLNQLSRGMGQRLLLAATFLGDSELFILDEPLNGLDPVFVIRLREKIDSLVKLGKTVILSSHVLGEIEKSCSHGIFIDSGKVITQGSLEEIRTKYGSIEGLFTQKL
jgi:ABC-2 type transport system ATP-binding protein